MKDISTEVAPLSEEKRQAYVKACHHGWPTAGCADLPKEDQCRGCHGVSTS